ncbi:MAG: DUF4446 family protein, partial [Candidatus Taylorbacteria bacterium]|nr:DUF4446 family protein [Candidatus Taylorbacteria bacterium]
NNSNFSDPYFLGFIIMIVVSLILIGIVIWMYFKLRRFLIGIDSNNINESLTFVSSNLNELQDFRKEMEAYLTSVENRLRKSIQSVHTVRFNPFKGAGEGGNQSFATAMLNQEGDGVVISSLYSRDHVSVFSKPIKNHSSEYELSQEERESVEHAKNNLKG